MSKKTIGQILFLGFILLFIIVLSIDYGVEKQTEKHIFTNTESIPENSVALLLGTSKYLKSGRKNQYFENRIIATELLYKAGKIRKVVISGDNSKNDYNEPQDMKEELLKRGIPENSIYLDYAGFRTFDSVYRMKEIFGQNHFTIISQEFHNQRAVYIAKRLNLDAIGFNAKDVDVYNGLRTKIREKFARVKVMVDFILNTKPKFLGEKITIE
ncbi:SanA/YdcF family protein [Pararhodonellum marinum]|uniref:SanA/YdcF family protein n=1 Tax=Pararhodonellum marinum TaxID=2755358 RepID=UPI0018902EE7|nr:ElyC/SanA/YdcF family protein [Pararhodonellum marinum]